MTKVKVSVIVAVYNVETYIEDALNSLLEQTNHDWEAIVVNDGSTDYSQTICEKFEQKDSRFHVYSKDNGGLSDARNFGLTKARGELICFLDGDDSLHPQFLEFMIRSFEISGTSISGCNFDYDRTSFSLLERVGSISLSQDEVIECYLRNDRKCEESVCNKLFQRKLFKTVRFPKGKIHEDTFVLIDLLMQCDRYIYVDFAGYNVVSRLGSITRSGYSEREFDKVEACAQILKKLKYTVHKNAAFNKYLGSLLWFIIKTNGKIDNRMAYMSLRSIPLREYRHAKLRFIPFLIAFRCRLLPYIQVK